MKRSHLIAVAAGLLVGGVALATQTIAGPPELLKYRQTIMKANGDHLGAIAMVIKGEVPYGVPHIVANAEGLAASATLVVAAFKDQTGDAGPTKAKPNIWTDWQTFTDKAKALEVESAKLVEIAKKGDMTAISEQVKAVGGACGGCHQTFREKTN